VDAEITTEQRRKQLKEIAIFHEDIHSNIPQTLHSSISKVNKGIKEIDLADHCYVWPIWCPYWHASVAWHFGSVADEVKKMALKADGSKYSSIDYHVALSNLKDLPESPPVLDEIDDMHKALVKMLFGVLDSSPVARSILGLFLGTRVFSVHDAFCGLQSLYEAHSWKQQAWFDKQFSSCGSSSTAVSLTDLENDLDDVRKKISNGQATFVPALNGWTGAPLAVVEAVDMSRGLVLLQSKEMALDSNLASSNANEADPEPDSEPEQEGQISDEGETELDLAPTEEPVEEKAKIVFDNMVNKVVEPEQEGPTSDEGET
jgi:hypothetical protein